ncbi:MAG TPA: 50S ribosomal protein L11 methyltransferase [Caulobacter sp.]|nr:50S ribosomal protein L11 methyltransferase [Caulobacter sp.]
MSAEIAGFILEHLPVAEVSEAPGVRLHLAGSHSRLWKLAERYPDMGSPYWAHPWGGGLALVRYLQAHPEAVAGRRVLDLGAGSGLVGIVAARAGAKRVTAVDVDPFAVAAIPMNAALNGVAVTARDAVCWAARRPRSTSSWSATSSTRRSWPGG